MQRLNPAQVSSSHLAQNATEAQGGTPVLPSEPGRTGEAEAAQAAIDTYDAFVSYRRGRGWQVALWLSHKLERYRAPKELLEQLPPALRERLQKSHRVFLDT